VKRFADRMVQEIPRQMLVALTIRIGADIPKALDAEHEPTRERLQRSHGSAFDRQYMHVMVEDHNKAVRLFHEEAGSGHNEAGSGHNAEPKQICPKDAACARGTPEDGDRAVS
jgi:predicted outer membrane protein